MQTIAHQARCILLYDQACMDHRECSFENENAAAAAVEEGSSSCHTPDVVVVDWPDAIVNHGLVVANAAMVLASMRWRRRRRRRRRSVDDDDGRTIVLPSYPASAVCIAFGEWRWMTTGGGEVEASEAARVGECRTRCRSSILLIGLRFILNKSPSPPNPSMALHRELLPPNARHRPQ